MFSIFRREDPALQVTIDGIYKEMAALKANDPEYQKMTARLTELNALKNKGVDPNTVLVILGNVALAMVVVTHEQTAVITTKVLPFLVKK